MSEFGFRTAVQKRNGILTALIFFQNILMADENNESALSPGHLLNEERVLRISPSSVTRNNESKCRIKIHNTKVRIATWNVRTVREEVQLEKVMAEMSRLNIDILGLSEVKRRGHGKQEMSNGVIYYSGNDSKCIHGTAIVVSNEVAKSFVRFEPLSDRVMLLRLQTSYRMMNIIQTYAPTTKKTADEEVEEFYSKVDEAIWRFTKRGELTIVIGDFNAKVGFGREGDVVGRYGLGKRNSRGDRLVQFCVENNLFIANTFFKQHPRRLYTWKSPADAREKIVRNQIDFILLGVNLRKYVQKVKTYPSVNFNSPIRAVISDHNPVVMDFRMRCFKKLKSTLNSTQRIDIRRLQKPELRTHVGSKFECELNRIQVSEQMEVEKTWNKIKTTIAQIQVQDIGYSTEGRRKEWMTEEILELTAEKRIKKKPDNSNPTIESSLYKELNKNIRRKCREAKQQWMSKKCREIEILQEKHDAFNVHKKIKGIANRDRKQITTLRDTNNKIVLKIEAKLQRWKQYLKKLFNDNRPNIPPQINENLNKTGPKIIKDEVIYAIKAQKKGKATGPDNIYAEVIKLVGDQEEKGLDLLTSLFNAIYKSGTIPSDWLKSTFIAIPKKTHASCCDDYRMISLMSHVLKIFLRIIHTRIYRKCEYQLDETQFGFRNGYGTREALFSLNVLTKRCRDMNVNVFACFINYKNAFDCVKHYKMIEILKATGIDREEIRIISNLYWQQTAVMKLKGATLEASSIKRGVRQGCVLSPLLFNIYSEVIFKKALKKVSGGIRINGKTITNIRYADDTVILARNMKALQRMVDRIVRCSEEFGLFMNTAKTKVLVFSNNNKIPVTRLTIKGITVEQVRSIKYLGTIVNNKNNPKEEIKSRIEQARKMFISMRRFFTSNLSLELKVRMIRCYVFSDLLYGCESWTLDPAIEKKLEAFEMYLYRRILRISWMQEITDEEVLNRMRKQRELMLAIKERKMRYIGHLMQGEKYELLRLIIEGKIQGKSKRRQNSWLEDIERWFNCTSEKIFQTAVSKNTLAIWIANLREETAS